MERERERVRGQSYVNGRTAVAVSNPRLILDTAGRHHDGGICTPPFSYRGNVRACGWCPHPESHTSPGLTLLSAQHTHPFIRRSLDAYNISLSSRDRAKLHSLCLYTILYVSELMKTFKKQITVIFHHKFEGNYILEIFIHLMFQPLFCYLKCAATYIPKQLTQWNVSHAQSAHIWVCAEWEVREPTFISIVDFIVLQIFVNVLFYFPTYLCFVYLKKYFSPCDDALEENHTDCKYISNQTKILFLWVALLLICLIIFLLIT